MNKNMMKKFWNLVFYGLKKRIATKTFIIVNIIVLVALLLIGAYAVSTLNKEKKEIKVTYYLSEENDILRKDVKEVLSKYDTKYKIKLLNDAGNVENYAEKDMKTRYLARLNEEKVDLVLYFANPNDINKLSLYILHNSKVSSEEVQNVERAFSGLKLSLQNINKDKIILKTQKIYNKQEAKTKIGIAFGIGMAIAIVTLFILNMLINLLGTEISQEKETRAVEILLSSVTPKVHFLSKVTSTVIFSIVQALIFIGGFFILGLVISSNFKGASVPTSGDFGFTSILVSKQFIYTILIAFAFLIVQLVASLLITGLIASLSNSVQEFQSAIAPITLLVTLPIYFIIFIGKSDSATLTTIVHVLSYIPFLSLNFAPIGFYAGMIAWYEVLISFLISLGLCIALVFSFSNIYRRNILSYSKSKFISKLTNIFKRKNKK